MPYIPESERLVYDWTLEEFANIPNKGHLEYIIFTIMKLYMKDKKWTYCNLHDTVYAVQHCADEYRRRFLDVREDEARERNGDI